MTGSSEVVIQAGGEGSPLDIAMLGPLQVCRHGHPIPLGGRQQRAVLAFLLTEPKTMMSRDQLADALWGDAVPAGYVATIQTYVFHLRKALEPERTRGAPGRLLVSGPGGYRLELRGSTTDVARFEALRAQGEAALSERDFAAAAGKLHEALGWWRGPVLADLADFAFIGPVAARLDELRLTAQESLVEAHLGLGRHAGAVADLDRLIARHPLRERLHGQRMLALYRGGRQSESLHAYRELRQQLREEMGIEPSPEIRELHQMILAQDPRLAWHPPQPTRRGQQDAAGVAAPRSTRPPTNQPQRNPIGRGMQLEQPQRLLLSEDVLVVAVTGADGVENTRRVEAVVALVVLEGKARPWLT